MSNSKQVKTVEPAATGMLAKIDTITLSGLYVPLSPRRNIPGDDFAGVNLLKEALDSWDAFVLKYPKGARPDDDIPA